MARVASIGDVRKRKGGEFKKVGAKKWVKVTKEKEKSKPTSDPALGALKGRSSEERRRILERALNEPSPGPSKPKSKSSKPKTSKKTVASKLKKAPAKPKSPNPKSAVSKAKAKEKATRARRKRTLSFGHLETIASSKSDHPLVKKAQAEVKATKADLRAGRPYLTDARKDVFMDALEHLGSEQKKTPASKSSSVSKPSREKFSKRPAKEKKAEVTTAKRMSKAKAHSKAFDRLSKTTAQDEFGKARVAKTDVDAKGNLKGSARDVFNATSLFTNGHVAAVRDPTKFQGGRGEVSGTEYVLPDGERRRHKVSGSAQDYQKAHEMMKGFASEPYAGKRSMHRGLQLSDSAIAELEPGKEMDLSPISSWTPDQSMAHSYSKTARVEGTKGKSVVLTLKKPKRGKDISSLSFWDDEEEFVTGGKVRVVSSRDVDGTRIVEVEHI